VSQFHPDELAERRANHQAVTQDVNDVGLKRVETPDEVAVVVTVSPPESQTEPYGQELSELKEAGEDDDLLGESRQEHQRRQLAERATDVREADGETRHRSTSYDHHRAVPTVNVADSCTNS
jgi:hypothetical protein